MYSAIATSALALAQREKGANGPFVEALHGSAQVQIARNNAMRLMSDASQQGNNGFDAREGPRSVTWTI